MEKKKSNLLIAGISVTGLCLVGTLIGGSNLFVKANGNSNGNWIHYQAYEAPAHGYYGVKEYWTNCAGSTVIEDPGETPAEERTATADDLKTIIKNYGLNDERIDYDNNHAHSFEGTTNARCSCGALNLTTATKDNDTASILRYSLEELDAKAPTGFSHVYNCPSAAGGSEGTDGNSFFIWGAYFGALQHISFAVLKTSSDNHVKILTPDYLQHSLPDVSSDTWIRFDIYKSSATEWTISNSLGIFDGEEKDLVVTPADNRLNSIFKVLFDANTQITEIVGTYTSEVHKHVLDSDNHCSICGKTVLKYADWLQNPENLGSSTYLAPSGFGYTYTYTGTTGGGQSGGFLKHAQYPGLASWDTGSKTIMKVEFDVWVQTEGQQRLRNNDGGGQTSIKKFYPCGFTNVTLNRITEGENTNKWEVKFNNEVQTPILPDANTWFAIFQLLNDEPTFTITEMLLTFKS